MKTFMQFFMWIHVTLYRLTNGSLGGHMSGGDVLLLTTTGRKSGKTRATPLMYLRDGENYLISASAAGAPKHPGWYYNAARGSHPVQIQVDEKVMNVEVEEATGDQRDELYQRFINMSDRFAGYEQKTSRTIPVLILKPTG